MNWKAYTELIKGRWQTALLPEKYRMACLLFADLPYQGGKETPDPRVGSDCSGIVCGALSLIGYPIRCRAADLYSAVFTAPVADGDTGRPDRIMAVFYETINESQHFGRVVPAGHIVHVAPVVGHWTVLDARETLEVWTAANARRFHARLDRRAHWRELDLKALELWTRSHEARLDPELAELIGRRAS